MAADGGGLADDDAGAVVDEEMRSDGGAGMDVDAGDTVGIFGHHAGENGDAHGIELVGDAEDADGFKRRIGQHDLVRAFRGGVALVSGLYVRFQRGLDLRQRPDQLQRLAHAVAAFRHDALQRLLEKDKGVLQAEHAGVGMPPPVPVA